MFQQMKQKLNIRQVVEFYGVRLNRANKGECPFHKEKTKGAFSVHDGKQIFNCFSCGNGGDLIAFVSQMFALSMLDACKKLNEDFSLGLTSEKLTPKQKASQARLIKKQKSEKEKKEKKEREHWNLIALYAEYEKIMIDEAPKQRFEPVNNLWIHANEMCIKLWNDIERSSL